MDINVIAKFDEIPSLLFQDIEKPKCRGRTDMNSIPPHTQTFAGGIKDNYSNLFGCPNFSDFYCTQLTVTANLKWTASSEFGTYSLCEQRRFRRACASAQSRQNLRCSLIQAVSQEEPSDRKPDPRPLWMAGHAQLKFVMTECSKTRIRLTGLK